MDEMAHAPAAVPTTVNPVILAMLINEFLDEEDDFQAMLAVVAGTTVMLAALAEEEERHRHPTRVEGYVEHTVPLNSDQEFKACFRMKRRTFEASTEESPAKEESKKTKKDNCSSDAKTSDGKKWNLKIVSWNVDGLRAWMKKDGLSVFEQEDPDIICLQETKCTDAKLPKEAKSVEGYKSYFMAAEKEGYSGVALYSKKEPLSITYGLNDKTHDAEGRCITAEYEKFYLVTAYVPNAGRKLVTLDKRMDWDPKFRKYLKELDAKKPVIMCGDLNVSHKEIDLANPKGNKKNAGFTPEEREGFTDLLAEGFVDSFRHLYPDKRDQYTFWTYMGNCRAKNVGWRLDYFVLSERLVPHLCDNVIRTSLYGSDHCPITLLMHL